MALTITPQIHRPYPLRPIVEGNGRGRTVIMHPSDFERYQAALEAFGINSHAYLRSCVAALIETAEQQKTA